MLPLQPQNDWRGWQPGEYTPQKLPPRKSNGENMDNAKAFLYMEQQCKTYRNQLPPPSESWLEDICRGYIFMNEHLFRSESTISSIKVLNRTPQKNFSGRFRIYTGFTPIAYRTHHRIEAAKKLLCDKLIKQVPMDMVAHCVGWERLQTFSTIFKNYTGLPPSDWRKQYFDKKEEN